MDTAALELVDLDTAEETDSLAEMEEAERERERRGPSSPFGSRLAQVRSFSVRRSLLLVKLHVQRRRKLALSLAVFLTAGIAANVFFKLELNAMYNYPLYTSQLNPVILAILFGIGLNVEIRCGKFDKEQDGRVNYFKCMLLLVLISFFDVAANVTELKSSDEMGKDAGPLSMLLAQCVIPFTMIFSVLLLRHRYNVLQIVSAVVILCGILVVVLPGSLATKSVVWTVVYSASRLPTSLNKVIKEYLFGRHAVSLLFVGFWEQTFNVAIGALSMLVCYPLIQGTPLREVPTVLLRGTWCALGRDSIEGDDCRHAPWLIPLFNLSAVVWMGSTLAVVKHGSATVAFLASAILIPLSDFFFASRSIFGKNAKVFHWFDIVGLLVIVSGMLAYGVGSVLQERRREREAAAAAVLATAAGGLQNRLGRENELPHRYDSDDVMEDSSDDRERLVDCTHA
ncbi:crt homolog 2-like [Sycon ciliatum]|uniref:crt homolog 2-like n=1 Tax=Sycon ciliatum TaxID=27933 RepID=UPI0020ADE700|eukprot:scpid63589/ scgid13106/ Crt homolog 1; Chloroquine resistance transporter paralog 1